MRIPRFYINDALALGLIVALPTDIHRHAIQVLRLKMGDNIILFNGEGGEYLACLTQVEKRRSTVSVVSFDAVDRESPLHISLALAMIKSDKMDFAIQKAVEMGVNDIHAIYTQRSVINIKANRLDKKRAHWQGVINGACEQSGRTSIPSIQAPIALESWLKKNSSCTRLAMLPGDYPMISSLEHPVNKRIVLIVGPEGGFSESEVELLLASDITGMQCGPRILRAETAVIAGLSLCQQCWGDV